MVGSRYVILAPGASERRDAIEDGVALKLGGQPGFWLLKSLSRQPPVSSQRSASPDDPASGASKLEKFFGPEIWGTVAGKRVLDYGCGTGTEVVAIALKGARHTYGLDVRDR